MEQFLITVFEGMRNLTYIPETVGVVIALTQLLKYAPPFAARPKETALVLQAALWSVLAVIRLLGYEIDLEALPPVERLLQTIVALVDIVAPMVLGGIVSATGSHVVYDFLHAQAVPGFTGRKNAS
jgi:hypothetical protein